MKLGRVIGEARLMVAATSGSDFSLKLSACDVAVLAELETGGCL